MYPPARDAIVGDVTFIYLFRHTVICPRSDPPTQVVEIKYSALPPLLLCTLAVEITHVLNPFIMNIPPSELNRCQLTGNLHLICLSGGSAHASYTATRLTICIKVILPDCFGDLTLPMEIM